MSYAKSERGEHTNIGIIPILYQDELDDFESLAAIARSGWIAAGIVAHIATAKGAPSVITDDLQQFTTNP